MVSSFQAGWTEVGPGSPVGKVGSENSHKSSLVCTRKPNSARSFVHARADDPDRTDLPHGN